MVDMSLPAVVLSAYATLRVPPDATPQAIMANYSMLVAQSKNGELSYDEPTKEEQQAKAHKLGEVSQTAQRALPVDSVLTCIAAAPRRPDTTVRSSGGSALQIDIPWFYQGTTTTHLDARIWHGA
jgi:hypothetical protein